jgi:glyoxylase-like metal-dependent hydrolase (beta-lactamase superfamily II)
MLPHGKTVRVADRVWVIPDQRVSLVPNVGIIEGSHGVLVVDTGMGPANAQVVLDEVRKLTDKRILYLVCTHFHPEHNFGAQTFPSETVIIYSEAQRRELEEKGQAYRELFVKLFGEDVRGLLEPVTIVPPDVTFESRAQINLGDRMVQLLHLGRPAHTRGDTLVFVPDAGVLFTGGLAVGRLFPIMADGDSSGNGWIANLDDLERLGLGIRTVVPDHGDIGGPELLAVIRQYLTDLRARVLELKGDKVSLSEIQERVFKEFSERYRDWGEAHWIRNAAEVFYAEDVPSG